MVGVAASVVGVGLLECGAQAAQVRVDRPVKDSRITESSGLTASLLHPGVLWTHNDSGNPPLLYALATNGSTTATLRIRHCLDRDWEAITSLRGPDGTPLLAVGDIGDNRSVHPEIEIVLVREQARLRSARVDPVHVLRLTYPRDLGPSDAETLLADPRTGRLYLVTKGLFSGRMFAVPQAVWPGGASSAAGGTLHGVLEPMGAVPWGLVTDGAFLPDGRIVLRTYSTIMVMPPPEQDRSHTVETLADADAPDQPQGEGLAVLPDGALVLSSEKVHQPILRVPLPPGTSPVASAPTGSATSQGARDRTASAAASRTSGNGRGAGGALLAAAVVVATALVVRRLRRH